MPDQIIVVGLPGNDVPPADVYAGGRRHLDQWAPPGTPSVVIGGDVPAALDELAAHAGTACVLASGDPGFFGIVRPLAARFGSGSLDVRPAPSSVSVAFARLGLPWDNATVVSAHGRPLAEAAAIAACAPVAAVLVSPDNPPEALAKELLATGVVATRAMAVCSRLGEPAESVTETDVGSVAAGTWDPLSVVILPAPGDTSAKTMAWGLPDQRFDHRAGMVTKAEVRAVALGKLQLPPHGVLWDVGAGSGSVAIECARLVPALRVIAIEKDPDDAARISANASAHGVAIEVVQQEAPACLAGLPQPDRVFVGGGGLTVLDAVLDRLPPAGRVVATYAALDRAAAAAARLGNVVQVQLSRGGRLPDGAFRLQAENPVFVCWGPGEDG